MKTKYLKSRKSQLKIQEMAFMLVAVVLFFSLVMMFGLSIWYKGIYAQVNKANQERTITSMTNLADTPEFRCAISKSNCIDGDKAISLLNKTVYKNLWPFSSLRILKFSGFHKNEEDLIECTFANYLVCKNIQGREIECSINNTEINKCYDSSRTFCESECDVITIYDKEVLNENVVSSYVAFCRKEYNQIESHRGYTYDKCEIAKIIAGTEEKTPNVKK
ncbi:MAG: hypothetical protein Q8N99_06030 [Nanoarchaeota archaeon]|nr:hypothetical protein [Nanoarchaeota archaeon]